jgi:hypothetical protein
VVFFKQLSSWLLYGQLTDQYAEFFIHHASDTQGTSTSTTLDSFSSQDINEMLSMVCCVLFSDFIAYSADSCDCSASATQELGDVITFLGFWSSTSVIKSLFSGCIFYWVSNFDSIA